MINSLLVKLPPQHNNIKAISMKRQRYCKDEKVLRFSWDSDSDTEDEFRNKRAKINSNAHEYVKNKMSARLGPDSRVQGQVQMFGDIGPNATPENTGLYVITSNYVKQTEESESVVVVDCFDKVYNWIWLFSHPTKGLKSYRITQKAWNKVPVLLNKKLYKQDKRGVMVLQTLIRNLCRGEDCQDKELKALWKSYGNRDEFKLPSYTEMSHINVYMRHVKACRGDLIFYKSFHGNSSIELPACVQHLDYIPHKQIGKNSKNILKNRYSQLKTNPTSLIPTKSSAADIQMMYFKSLDEFNTGVPELPEIPDDPYVSASLGKTEYKSIPTHQLYERDIVTKEDKNTLKKRGYVVIPMRERLPKIEYTEWIGKVKAALKDFGKFFNWAILERNGVTDKSFDLENRQDPTWDLLRGEAKCKETLGLKLKKILYMSKKTKTGDIKFCGTAQGGNGMCTKTCGMGHATNYFRSTESLSVSSSKYVVRCFQQLYNETEVHNCTDRWRLKVGTGNDIDNLRPKTNIMPCHEDRLAPPLFNTTPTNTNSNK